MTTPLVTVVVPTFNGAERLPALFAALERQTVDPALVEVIVVDDQSTDATAEIVTASRIARVLRAPERGGSYRARNLAIAEARGELLAFTDDDCSPAPEWLVNGIARFTVDPGLGLLAGAVEIALPERPTAAALVDAARCMDQERYATRKGYGITANLWVRRSVAEATNGFNGAILSGGDADFCFRAVEGGARLEYGPDVLVYHPPRERAAQVIKKSWRLGYGAAQHRFHAQGKLREQPLEFLNPGGYIPTGGLQGLDRIERQRHRLGRWDRTRLATGYYFLMKLPSTFGNLVGFWDEVRGGRGSRIRRGL